MDRQYDPGTRPPVPGAPRVIHGGAAATGPTLSVLRFWSWVAAAVLLAMLVPVTAALGFPAADSTRMHLAIACVLPLMVGMAFRAFSAAINAVRTG